MSWALVGPEFLVEREWSGEVVVLDTRSGNTHLLTGPAFLVYRQLQSGPLEPQLLLQRLSALLPLAATADEPSIVLEATLQEMARRGLIETCAR